MTTRLSSLAASGPPAPAQAEAYRARLRSSTVQVACSLPNGSRKTYERVLRYPTGEVRRIRYPRVEDDLGSAVRQESAPRSQQWDRRRADAAQASASTQSPTADPLAQGFGNSPAELVRYLRSDALQSAQQRYWERLRSTYEVLESCPWVQPRAVSVLAVVEASGEAATVFTLRTSVRRKSMEAELTKLLGGRTGPDGKGLMGAYQVRDGVLAFQDADDAERFAQQLEAESDVQVAVAQVDSHEFFRQLQSAKAVLVYLKSAPGLPSHQDLAASLQHQQPVDDWL